MGVGVRGEGGATRLLLLLRGAGWAAECALLRLCQGPHTSEKLVDGCDWSLSLSIARMTQDRRAAIAGRERGGVEARRANNTGREGHDRCDVDRRTIACRLRNP